MLELMKGESWSWDLNPGSCPPEPASSPLASRACPTVGLSQCFLTGMKEQLASTGHRGCCECGGEGDMWGIFNRSALSLPGKGVVLSVGEPQKLGVAWG